MMNKIKGFFKLLRDAVNDPERDFSERVFLILTMISEVSVIAGLIFDILYGESLGEIIVIAATAIVGPVLTVICLYKNKLKIAMGFLVTGITFIVIPSLFILGGGVEGGGVLWIVFAFLYVGSVVSGIWRTFMLVSLVIISASLYMLEYYHPELINGHSRGLFFIDSCISLTLVGLVCFVMTYFQNKLFSKENERARKAAEKAEELSRSQNRFFSSMSHEIRTPINSILGLNELILRDENTSDEIVKDASGIQGAGKMLLALINDILDFSKMEAGSMDIVPVDYRVGEMLSEIVNMIWQRAADKGLRFDVNVDPEVPSILYGDEVRIKQVIVNLLNNAIKYTNEGSIELSLESDAIDDEHVMLTISVSDTGMGIKKESMPFLFDAFKRVDEEKNRHIEGTGLGLSIVRQIVDLMGGTVSVNSIYGEGSVFTVTLRQKISDHTQIGELNIHNQSTTRKNNYESSFKAPEAKILIVDDNVMNLEVECRLLAGTEMTIDKAVSGSEALEMTLRNHYDTILMDHLMPKMDGIECLERIRKQSGGLNRTTPIVVLTANAGSENRELYNSAGFDGYLVKPVSGESLEEMLIRHISRDKLIISSRMIGTREDIDASSGFHGKVPVIITTSSMCDLPDALVKEITLPIIPFLIHTDEGVFKDGVQMDADELIRYIRSGKNTKSSPPTEAAYTEFFANALKRAHHLIHISITTSMSEDHKMACEAAKAFDNVTVVNSESISSATGLLVLIAYNLAQQGIPVPNIVSELEMMRKRLRCGFIIDTTDFMAKNGLISEMEHSIAKSLSIHSSFRVKDDKNSIGGVWLGKTKRAYKKYIASSFPVDIIPDPEVVFITYVDLPMETLYWIREEISKIAYFEHVVFKQASAAISSNCGPGSFGILYFVKGNRSYNIGKFFEYEHDYSESEDENEWVQNLLTPDRSESIVQEVKWYDGLDFIDTETAIQNSGSEESFKTVLKIFFDSIGDKSDELEGYYSSQDWESYTIKVHALKSSSRLIGATGLADKAQLLETAGKDGNIGYIKESHAGFMNEFRSMKTLLSGIFKNDGSDRPVADDDLMNDFYEGLRKAAGNMDCDTLESIFAELEEYTIPEKETGTFEKLRKMTEDLDYDGILDLLKNRH